MRTQTPRLAVCFGVEDADPMQLGEETNTSPLSSLKPAAESIFVSASH